MRVAQILNDRVHWIFETSETIEQVKGRFAPSIIFAEIGTDVQEGWGWDGTQAVATVEKTADEQKAAMRVIAANLLRPTDYKALKFIDGALTEAEYAPIREYRQSVRDHCNERETQIDAGVKGVVW